MSVVRPGLCAVCGHSRVQHRPAEPDDEPGCWGRSCIEGPPEARCAEFAETKPRARRTPDVDREVAPVGNEHPDTAQIAASIARLRAGTRRKEAFDAIRLKGLQGLTDDELEALTGRSHQSLSATRNTLMNDGLIVDSGHRRPTRYGSMAIVWVVPGLETSDLANS